MRKNTNTVNQTLDRGKQIKEHAGKARGVGGEGPERDNGDEQKQNEKEEKTLKC